MDTVKPKAELEFRLFVDGNKVTTQDYYYHSNRYKFASYFTEDKLCLDIGCGTGYGSAYLTRKGARTVIAGDKSADAISYTRSTATTECEDGLEFSLFEATSLPFADDSFDIVICFEVIEHLKNYERLLSETQRVLRRGGKLILSTPNRQAGCIILKLPYHIHEFSESQLLDSTNEYYHNSVIYGQSLLNKRSIILRRLTWTAGRLLEIMGLRNLEIWLGRLLFGHNRLITFNTKDFDNLADKEGEVVPLTDGLTPTTFVIVATMS